MGHLKLTCLVCPVYMADSCSWLAPFLPPFSVGFSSADQTILYCILFLVSPGLCAVSSPAPAQGSSVRRWAPGPPPLSQLDWPGRCRDTVPCPTSCWRSPWRPGRFPVPPMHYGFDLARSYPLYRWPVPSVLVEMGDTFLNPEGRRWHLFRVWYVRC